MKAFHLKKSLMLTADQMRDVPTKAVRMKADQNSVVTKDEMSRP
ncbi:MAG TPA: hypothetical protein VGJ85_01795 [Candidatus Nanopelagicaceae bacterium]